VPRSTLNILHVIANLSPRYGGPSKACVEMARATARRGHSVDILTTDQDGPGRLDVPLGTPVVEQGVSTTYFPVSRPRFWGFSAPLGRALRLAIPRHDVVHVHSLYLFHDLVAGHLCRKHGVPYLVRPHGTLDPYIHRRHRLRKQIVEALFENRNLRGAAALHFTSEDERRLAVPYTFGAPGVVIPLGLDLDDYRDLPAAGTFKAAYPVLRDKRVLLFLGRLNFKKGLDILIRAFARICDHRTDTVLVLAGPDNDGLGPRVRAWAVEAGVDDRVLFTGMLLGRVKLAALRDAELFALPSHSENFGISVIEAMACGVPVVISDKVNLSHDVRAADAGLVTPCDADRVGEALLDLLDRPEDAARMGKNGRCLIEECFQWPAIAAQLEALYLALSEGRSPMDLAATERQPQRDPIAVSH
jgi:glycosyltransferase involved in cell wall biosynthesis